MISREFIAWLIVSLVAFLFLGCGRGKYVPETARGAKLAQKHCTGCHVFPEPNLLQAADWPDVLNAMAPFLGIRQHTPTTSVWDNSEMIKSAPVVTDAEWNSLSNFYLKNAASKPEPRIPPEDCSLRFKSKPVDYPSKNAFITFLKIDPAKRKFMFSDIADKRLFEYSYPSLKRQVTAVGAAVTDHIQHGRLEYMTGIGDVYSFRDPRGFLFRRTEGRVKPLISNLLRPASILSTAGITSTVRYLVADFGLADGQLLSYDEEFKEMEVVIQRPGVVSLTRTRDGRIFALTSQAVERISEIHQEQGRLVERVHEEFPPSYGGSSIRAADLDNDGKDELIVTHGDNGDFSSMPLRPYQGVRVYKVDRENKLRLFYFYPMYGAYKTAVADFDGDGFLDIAATAYFYDRTARNPQKFIILRSSAGMAFSSCTVRDASRGRWMAIDAGDLTGDGKPDLVLGGAYFANFDMGNADGLGEPSKRASLLVLENEN